MKKIDNVNNLVSEIIESRQRTQNQRFKKLDSDVEKVSDVIDLFLSQLCDALSKHKFKYSKSKKQLHKTVNGFRLEITCRSSSLNLSGIYVGVSFMISIKNNRYKKWYSSVFPFSTEGNLVACDLGKLADISSLCKWEISNPNTRPESLHEISALIDEHVMFFYENFKCEDTYRKYLREFDFRVIFKSYAVEHAVWLNDISLARKLINEILTNSGHTLEQLNTQKQIFIEQGYPEYVEDELGYWAKASILMELF